MDARLVQFGRRLQKLRKRHGLSQQELGELVGKSQTAISDWESGLVDVGYIELIKLSDLFGVPIMYWFVG